MNFHSDLALDMSAMLWPIKLMLAIGVGMLLYGWLTDLADRGDDDDTPATT